MKVIYIIGKYTDETEGQKIENIIKAREKGEEYAKKGYAIICPHTNFKGHKEVIGYEKVMKECFELIKRADIVYVLNNYMASKGSKREIRLAKKLGKKILYE